MSSEGNAKGGAGNREQEISAISRSLKQLAKELNVPVIALSQLSRSVETRGGDKRPQLSDLRESGAIEQDADMVVFLYRPEYYKIDVDENGNSTKGMGEVIIAKHRNGSLESVWLRFIGQYTKFCDLDRPDFGSSGGDAFDQFDSSSKTVGSKMNNFTNNFDSNFGSGGGDDKAPF
jgi:replicative DNA helicase